jgi:RNA polymerase sigma-70 factor (ECF subfamily)
MAGRSGHDGEKTERKRVDDDAFGDFFSDNLDRVQGLASRITGNGWDAEDVAVEAFARAYARWDRLAAAEWRTGWVLKVAGNLAIDIVRRRGRTVLGTSDDDLGGRSPARLDPASDRAEPTVDRLVLSAALRQLPRREKEVVVMIGLCGCSHEHAAGVLGISTGSTKTYLHRAMRHLRSELEAEKGLGGELTDVLD